MPTIPPAMSTPRERHTTPIDQFVENLSFTLSPGLQIRGFFYSHIPNETNIATLTMSLVTMPRKYAHLSQSIGALSC
jgi:hypothetical protein